MLFILFMYVSFHSIFKERYKRVSSRKKRAKRNGNLGRDGTTSCKFGSIYGKRAESSDEIRFHHRFGLNRRAPERARSGAGSESGLDGADQSERR